MADKKTDPAAEDKAKRVEAMKARLAGGVEIPNPNDPRVKAAEAQKEIEEVLDRYGAQIVTRLPPPKIQETTDGGFLFHQEPAVWGVAVPKSRIVTTP